MDISNRWPVALRRRFAPAQVIHLELLGGVFAACLSFSLLFWSGHHYSIDGIVMFESAKALLFRHSWVMDPPLEWSGLAFTVSKWPVGLTLLYLPFVALLSVTVFAGQPSIAQIPSAGLAGYQAYLIANPPYRFASLVHPLITALSAVLVFELGLQVGLSKRRSAAAALVFGLASPAAVYARFDYAQPLAGLFLLAAVWLVFRARAGSRWSLALAGAALGAAGLARSELFLLGGVLLGAAVFLLPPASGSGCWRPLLIFKKMLPQLCFAKLRQHLLKFHKSRVASLLLFLFPVGLLLVASLAASAARFGSLTSSGYSATEGDLFTRDPLRIAVALTGNLISPGRGILVFFPLALLSPLGGLALFRRDRWAAGLLAGLVLAALGLYSAWLQWAAGIDWGPRFLIPFLPYLTLLAFLSGELFPGQSRRVWLAGLAVLACLGAVAALQGFLFDPVRYYTLLRLPDSWIAAGDYNFNPAYSPLFTGWYGLPDLHLYDSYLVQQALLGSRKALLALGFLLALFLGGLIGWIRWFSRSTRS